MIDTEELEQALYHHLPVHLHLRAAELARLLADIANQAVSPTQSEEFLKTHPALATLIDALNNAPIRTPQATIEFKNDDGLRKMVISTTKDFADSTIIGRDQMNLPNSQGAVIQPHGPVVQQYIILPPAPAISPSTGVILPRLFKPLKVALAAVAWPLSDLVGACRASAPPRYTLPTLDASADKAAAAIVDALAVASGVTPLLAFVERLARMPAAAAPFDGAPLAATLRDWVNQAAADAGLTPTELATMRAEIDQSAPPAPPTNPYVLFAAVPSLQHRGRFRTQAWFWTDQFAFCLHIADTPCTSAQLPHTLDQLLNEVASYQLATTDELAIALFLPLEQLGIDLQRWKIKLGNIDVPLPSSYPIALRSLERIYQDAFKKTWGIWERNWGAVRQPPQHAAIWHDTATMPPFDQLAKAVLLTVALAPPMLTEKLHKAILAASISAGTPVILWLRSGAGTPEEVRKELEPLLAKDLDQLPRRLFDRRQQACGAAPWPYVVLLLDDPQRRPLITTRWRSPR